MRTNNAKWALLGCLVATWGFAACGSDDNKNPSPVTSSTSTGGPASSSDTSTSTSTGMGGATSSGATSGGGMGGAGGSGGCFKGSPMTEDQFLNQCTSSDCQQYDNSKLKLLNPDGTLPALP